MALFSLTAVRLRIRDAKNIQIYILENDKEYRLGKKLTMMCIGEEGDVAQFGDWTKRNLQLYSVRNGYEVSPSCAHHFVRRSIAEGLRSQDHYTVDVLIGGYDDKEDKAFLGSVDYLANGLGQQVFSNLLSFSQNKELLFSRTCSEDSADASAMPLWIVNTKKVSFN